MAGSTIGETFRVHTFGVSHTSDGVGAIIDGCPAGIPLSEEDIQPDLDRRRPGQSRLTTQRKESDEVTIQSGIFEGYTTGDPISLFIPNTDAKPGAYEPFKDLYRPSHADFTYDAKYGRRDYHGGARASARTTAAVTAAGAVAKLVVPGVSFTAYVESIYDIEAQIPEIVTREMVEANDVRCPDPEAAERMAQLITRLKKAGNSAGGIIEMRISGLPVGLGEPVFDKFYADMAKAIKSIPAVKAVEFGLGFAATRLLGSEHNDPFYMEGERVRTRTNNSGGTQGGITNGEDVILRAALKPTATIVHEQETVTTEGEATTVSGTGRHDVCVLPRAVPIFEAMAAIVVADHFLRNKTVRARSV
jgi:chorismate synthase